MSAQLFNLKCHVCGQVQQSMTILLPEHGSSAMNGNGIYAIPVCEGSNTLAHFFADECPACQVHGRRADCGICKGKNEVLTAIEINIQRKAIETTPEDWEEIELERVSSRFDQCFKNPDDAISAMYSGQPVRTPFAFYRIKPRINQTKPDDEPSLNNFVAEMLDETSYKISVASFPGSITAAKKLLRSGQTAEQIEKATRERFTEDRIDILVSAIHYMANHPETWKEK